jgi:hypothetical protein
MTAPLPVSPPFGFGAGNGSGVTLPPNVAAQRGVINMTRALQIPMPEVFPIPDAHEFNITGSVASPGAANNVAITGCTFDIPDASLAIIRSVSLYITGMIATTNVLWSLLRDNQPLPGYQNISIFPRAVASIGLSLDAFLRVRGKCTISMQFSNIDGAAYVVGGAFSGWYWPETSDARWRATGE